MTKPKNIKHVYFDVESSINSVFEKVKESKGEILESEIGYNHRDFALRILDAMKEIGMSTEELALSTYISPDKLKAYFKHKQFLNFTERRAVGKVLGF